MKDKFKNLLSRKFIIALVIAIGGVGTAFQGTDDITLKVIGIVCACVAAIVYNYIEGKCDAASITGDIAAAVDELQALIKSNKIVVDDNGHLTMPIEVAVKLQPSDAASKVTPQSTDTTD